MSVSRSIFDGPGADFGRKLGSILGEKMEQKSINKGADFSLNFGCFPRSAGWLARGVDGLRQYGGVKGYFPGANRYQKIVPGNCNI